MNTLKTKHFQHWYAATQTTLTFSATMQSRFVWKRRNYLLGGFGHSLDCSTFGLNNLSDKQSTTVSNWLRLSLPWTLKTLNTSRTDMLHFKDITILSHFAITKTQEIFHQTPWRIWQSRGELWDGYLLGFWWRSGLMVGLSFMLFGLYFQILSCFAIFFIL